MYTFLFLFRSLYMYKQLCTIENRLPSDSIFYLPTESSTFRQYLQPHERVNSMLSFVQGRKVPENLILAITG